MTTFSNIFNKFQTAAEKNPEKPAIIEPISSDFRQKYRSVSFAEMNNDIIQTAQYFREKGIKKSSRLIVFVPMSYDLYKDVLALFYCGAVACFVDAWSNRKRLELAIKKTSPIGFIGSPKSHLLRFFSKSIRQLPLHLVEKGLKHDFYNYSEANFSFTNDFDHYPAKCQIDDEALVTFTTGSTGEPKAASRTHGFLLQQHKVLSYHFNLRPDDIDMPTLPVFVLNNLALGITTVLPKFNLAKPHRINAGRLIKQMNGLKVTTTVGAPAFFRTLATYILKERIVLPLRKLFIGGAPVYPNLAQLMTDAFPKVDMTVLYGSTEAEPISSLPLFQLLDTKPENGLPVGKPISEIKLKLIKIKNTPIELKRDETIDDICVEKGEIGEVIVSGKHVLKDYIDSPEMFKINKIVENNVVWHRTGDAARFDNEHNVFLFGRVSLRFKEGNSWRYPLPVEMKLLQIEGISVGTLVKRHSKIIIFIETISEINQYQKEIIKEKIIAVLQNLHIDNIIFLKKMPRDARHNSRINYDKLPKHSFIRNKKG